MAKTTAVEKARRQLLKTTRRVAALHTALESVESGNKKFPALVAKLSSAGDDFEVGMSALRREILLSQTPPTSATSTAVSSIEAPAPAESTPTIVVDPTPFDGVSVEGDKDQ